MPTFTAIVSIRASRDQVWALLTDVEGYRSWNRTFPRISGAVRLGATLSAHASAAGTRAYRIAVEEFLPGENMVWCGTSALGWTRRQSFALRPGGDGLVEFKIQEEHKGLLCAWWVGEQRERQAQIDRFAVLLKERAEVLSLGVARQAAAVQARPANTAEIQLIDNTSLQNLSLATAFYTSTIEMGYPNLNAEAAVTTADPAADQEKEEHAPIGLDPIPAGSGNGPGLRAKCQSQGKRQFPGSTAARATGRLTRSERQ